MMCNLLILMVPIIGTKHQYNQLFYNKNQERLNSNAPKYAPHNYAFIVKYQGLYMHPTITMYLSQLKIRKNTYYVDKNI